MSSQVIRMLMVPVVWMGCWGLHVAAHQSSLPSGLSIALSALLGAVAVASAVGLLTGRDI